MRVLVCGGRDFNDKEKAFAVLNQIRPTFIIEGGAKGADTLAWLWRKRNLSSDNHLTIEARWDVDGKAAGPIRNQRMIDEGKPDLVVAFPGGRGTADMVRRAKRAGIEVRIIK
ncbi:DUF2493 domain-containing protein [Paracoccus sp. DMF-8]|uniref:DUF2493 domain-containing protein n=1 Tax=Paracoccus sp. DMF-8 TaxID=3019445 RepID=UPI0023E46970|nr:DUF2493 domain-containing protein [Paracoccus sp. DMF-8]MDF3607511.1 DUF2493 domain-containing protein [Paracoccus sp. DMF-8]